VVLAAGAAVALAGTRRLEVAGSSMTPTLVAGDRLVVVRLPARWPLRRGDLVALPDPRPGEGHRLLVKRVVAPGPADVEVTGDHRAASTDSATFGPVPRRSVVGRVVYRYGPPGRTGWLGRAPRPEGPVTGRDTLVDDGERPGREVERPRRLHP
jgi:signal peptidase I